MMSKLTKISALLAVFFALDKGVALLRQVIIARQFGLSAELDAFNVANNVPDMLFALISGGALAMAFIPMLSEALALQGRGAAWDLFSRIANLAFLVTAALALATAVLAGPMVRWEVGIAPGFGPEQQNLVAELMRLNLAATLIFSISGLVMGGLQANQHFLLPAMAPLLYNVGQIFGALVLAPEKSVYFAGIHFPAMGLGVHGLVYGVIIGAVLHLAIQIPGLIHYQFRWTPKIGLNTRPVRRVLELMGPRLLTMLCIQLVFLIRDNLASRLAEGAVSALTYSWMVMQVPETLIGTAIGTALLPTLAEQFSRGDREGFWRTIERAVRVLAAATIPIAVALSIGLKPLLTLVFGFNAEGSELLAWTTRGFMAGLLGHCLMEVAARSFYARQDALPPLATGALNVVVYIGLGSLLFNWFGAPGISFTDAFAFTLQAVLLLWVLQRRGQGKIRLESTPWRTVLAALSAGLVSWGLLNAPFFAAQPVLGSLAAMTAGGLAALPWVWTEIRMLLRL